MILEKRDIKVIGNDPSQSGANSGGGGSSYIDGEVLTFTNLPVASSHSGEFYLVKQSSGIFIINRKPKGLYYSDGSTWESAPDIVPFFDDDNFEIYNHTDNSKKLDFQLSSITSGTTRALTIPNKSGIIALTSDLGSAGGAVYINDITPTSGGNVGDKLYLAGSNNNILTSCSADDLNIRVHIIALIGNSNLRPSVDINGTAVGNWNYLAYETDNRVLFKGYADILLSGTTIIATHEDGITTTCELITDTPPVISNVNFLNGYHGTQTELKAGDVFAIRVQTDIDFVTIEIENSGACNYKTDTAGASSDRTLSGIIADRGDVNVARPARVRVQKASGTWSNWVYTNVGATTTDGTNLVFCNNLYPTIGAMNQTSITYPGTQEAIKNVETVSILSVCSDYNTIAYSSPTGELTIPTNTTYASPKLGVARNSGNYNVTAPNYQISANRTANDATTTENVIVYIAHVGATLTVTEPTSRLRSGGNDGTSVQNHTITATANQNLISAPTIANPVAGGGIWSGLFINGSAVWNRTLQINDTDTVGAYAYGALSAYNLAEIETTAYTGDSNYIIGGFVSRVLTLTAYANEVVFNASTVDFSKCTLVWSGKALPNKRAYNTTTVPDSGSWTFAGTLNVSPTTARILDTASTGASSVPTTVTIEEVV